MTRSARRVVSLQYRSSEAIGGQRTCRERRERVDLTKMTHSRHRRANFAVTHKVRQGLSQLGYREGQNIVIEFREAHGQPERFAMLATELVRRDVDLIVAPNTPAARAARQATTTIPIVGFALGDAVEDGLVSSLARPGGNVTGLTFLAPELTAKRLQLLKDVLPTLSRVAALWHPGAFGERTTGEMLKTSEAAATALGLQLQMIATRSHEELDEAFSSMTGDRIEAVFVFPSPLFFSGQQRIAALALRHRLPSMFVSNEFVHFGGLVAYGASITDLARRGAMYVDKILKGAKPAELPVEQPTKFELSINLRTAKTLGIVVSANVQQLADEVIE
jgi:putative tryptophan/tyrosine transport system substrate-binding protein